MEESAHAQDERTPVNVSTGSASPASAAGPGADTAVVAVELRSVTKRYGTLAANDDISLTVRSGEIHVLVGENGAGKSTLMGILSGTVKPDAGQVLIRGEDVTGYSPRAAIVKGIGMVHQHFRLAGAFTVAQNIALGFEPRGRFGLLDSNASRVSARTVSDQFGLSLDPDAVVGDLPVGLQQRVEIVKTLMRDAHVLIFDEPTAVLTEEESAALFTILRKLREDGRAIIFITHKLREALALADTVSVLRRGKLVATLDPGQTTVAELGTLMVGRAVNSVSQEAVGLEAVSPEAGRPGPDDTGRPAQTDIPAALAVRDAALRPRTLHAVPLSGLNLNARPGEIVSVLGVDGNGQQEIFSLLTGIQRPDEGTISIDGRNLTGRNSGAFLAAGLGVVPADRHREGLVLPMSIARNLVLDRRHERRFLRLGGLLLNERALNAYARDMIAKYDIRAQRPDQPVASLSGGNQQKVVLARELERDIRVLVAAHPTRGLDVGSIEYVHRKLLELRAQDRAVIVVTSDLDEATALSDVIYVLYRGAFAGVVRPPFSRHELGILMGGT
jgi:general nucleoside transport system ATP-binding protein